MFSYYMRKLFTLLFTLLWFVTSTAAPARRNIITITQPDGTTLEIRMIGNELCHYTETTDGIMIAQDRSGIWHYAIEQSDGTIAPSNRIAHSIDDREHSELKFINSIDQNRLKHLALSKVTKSTNIPLSKSSLHDQGIYSTTTFPTKGDVKGLVLLVDFPDRSFSLEDDAIIAKFNDMLNKTGYSDSITIRGHLVPGAYGSAKDYFEAQSFGKFRPTFDIIGPITADNGYAYYGQNDSNGNDEVYTAKMISEIVQKVYNSGQVDFSKYDNDNDMEIDFIYVIYAGKGENYTGSDPYTIWPHQWYVENKLGNYWTGRYACSSEIYFDEEYLIDGIGTFCHEFSHILGLPDFYPTNSYTNQSTFREWSVMDYGCYDNYGFAPVGYTALERYSLGWMNLTEITSPGNYVLPAIDSAQTAYLLPSDEKLSYILLETHNKEGWYQYQPTEGLLVTSVDYDRTIWMNNTVNNNANEQRYKVIAADNDYKPDTKHGDLFPYNGNDSLTLYSAPQSITGCGVPIDIPIKSIKYNNGISTFSIIDRVGTSINSSKVFENEELYYTVTGNGIVIKSEVETQVTIYSITGRMIDSVELLSGESKNLSLPQKGIYLLRYNNRVIKITN